MDWVGNKSCKGSVHPEYTLFLSTLVCSLILALRARLFLCNTNQLLWDASGIRCCGCPSQIDAQMHIFEFSFTPHHRGVIILKKQTEMHSPAITDTNLQENQQLTRKLIVPQSDCTVNTFIGTEWEQHHKHSFYYETKMGLSDSCQCDYFSNYTFFFPRAQGSFDRQMFRAPSSDGASWILSSYTDI